MNQQKSILRNTALQALDSDLGKPPSPVPKVYTRPPPPQPPGQTKHVEEVCIMCDVWRGVCCVWEAVCCMEKLNCVCVCVCVCGEVVLCVYGVLCVCGDECGMGRCICGSVWCVYVKVSVVCVCGGVVCVCGEVTRSNMCCVYVCA